MSAGNGERPLHDQLTADTGDAVAVQTICVWKNLFWSLQKVVSDPGVWTLALSSSSPRGYPDVGPFATASQRKTWPGLDVWDRDDAWVEVHPDEVALIRVEVMPVDDAGRAVRQQGRAWWRSSLASSPWLPRYEAVAAVARFLDEAHLLNTESGVDSWQVTRLRDGWRVATASMTVASYVADDGVVLPLTVQMPFDEASRVVTAGLRERLQAGPRILDAGPGTLADGPTFS